VIFQVLTAVSMMVRIFWDALQYIPEDSELGGYLFLSCLVGVNIR
jgi:hypothetical protein